MKKVLIIVFILLLLGGGGAGYYFFVMKEEAMDEGETEQQGQMMVEEAQPPTMEEIKMEPPKDPFYYVNERRVAVRNAPNRDGLAVDTVYKGEKLEALETQGDWIRITEYVVYQEGDEEVAEWVNLSAVSDDPPVIEEMERLEILDAYIHKSDDLKQHQTLFRTMTQQLLDDATCKPEDFEELGGWVRSVTFEPRSVYFIYCGGLRQANKIYLDTESKEIFYR